ncbi:MAG TPA: hypothetical protein VK610_08285 [Rhodothermales bacterium]|nr:hypothetical protein [Rhodothermales bacterium]
MSATARFLLLAALVLGAASPEAARAQDERGGYAAPPGTSAPESDTGAARTLEIRAGALWLDGRRLPASSVPAGLDLNGLAMAVQFSGPVTPVVEIDGVAYMLEGERLVRFDQSSRAGDQVYFLGEPQQVFPDAPPPAAESASGFGAVSPARTDRAMPANQEMARARTPVADADDAELREAGEAAYMRDLSASDRALYEKMRREAELEEHSLALAGQIRATPEGAERDSMVEELRTTLETAFDLKQEIRAEEIARAESQVAELRRMLRIRAERKGQIIDHRLRELVGH